METDTAGQEFLSQLEGLQMAFEEHVVQAKTLVSTLLNSDLRKTAHEAWQVGCSPASLAHNVKAEIRHHSVTVIAEDNLPGTNNSDSQTASKAGRQDGCDGVKSQTSQVGLISKPSLSSVSRVTSTKSWKSATAKIKVLNQMNRLAQEQKNDPKGLHRMFMPVAEVICGPTARLAGPPVFADPDDLKSRLHDIMANGDKQCPFAAYKESGICQRICRNRWFDYAGLGLVLFSSLWISVDTDFNEALLLSESHWIFQVVAHLMCALFCTEIILRWFAFRSTSDALMDFSFIFDGLLVALMVLETWVATLILVLTGWNAGANVRAFVALRMLRLCRALRLARVLRSCPELLVIVRGVGLALRAISVVLALLSVIIYVGAIIFRIAAEGSPVGDKRFSSVTQSMGTLLVECTLSGSKCGPVMYEANESSFLLATMIFLFVLVANITMMGVLTGLLVQTVRTTAEVEKEAGAVDHVSASIDDVWERVTAFDTDGDGRISESELGPMLLDEPFARTLLSVGVDLDGFFDMSQFIFKQYGGSLGKGDFKKVMLDLRGREQAKVKHHIETRKYIHSWLQEAKLNIVGDLAKKGFPSTNTSGNNAVRTKQKASVAPAREVQQSASDLQPLCAWN